MKLASIAACGLTALMVAGTSHAQVDYGDIQPGSMLDGKGIRIGAFIKPVPLPPGNWQVVARNDSRRELTGGSGSFNSTSQVTLTLKSTNADNGILAMVVSFAPDSTPVNWNGNYCQNAGKAIAVAYGNAGYGSAKACATGQWYSGGLQKFIAGAVTHADTNIRNIYGALTPYLAQMPDAYVSLQFNARRDRGRALDYVVFGKLPPVFKLNDRFDMQIREWVKASSQSMMDMLENTATAIPAFPATEASTPWSPSAAATSASPGVSIDAVQVGSLVTGAIALEPFAKPMPLPPGNWQVVGRFDKAVSVGGRQMTAYVALTLKNTDINAGIAAMVLTFNPERYTAHIDANKCDSTQYSILEDYGTTAQSPVFACTYGSRRLSSFKQRVAKAEQSTVEWDKSYLSPLAPYLAELPDQHLLLWFTVNRANSHRLSFMLFSRLPPEVKPGDPFDLATRSWIVSTGHGLIDFLENKASTIAAFPSVQMTALPSKGR